MSRHEGVSCDSCLKGNFRGRRYKCLICYDYDLCAACYEAGATNTSHTIEHPMQCILTRSDFELYYGGEALTVENPQAFTCPYCGKMGFTEVTLLEHVNSAEHAETSPIEVVCPVCAALPGGDPNLVTDEFAGHLSLDHRGGGGSGSGGGATARGGDLDEPSSGSGSGSRHGGSGGSVRRIPHPSRGGVGAPRPRRSNMHFSSSGGLSSLSPSSRDSVDPIAELLSQLSGVRRSATAAAAAAAAAAASGGGGGGGSTPSQLHQLQMQLQLERQQVRGLTLMSQAARQQLERLPRRQAAAAAAAAAAAGAVAAASSTGTSGTANSTSASASAAAGASSSSLTVTSASNSSNAALQDSPSAQTAAPSQFLLARCMEPTLTDAELQECEVARAGRSLFVQELVLASLAEAVSQLMAPPRTPTPQTQNTQQSTHSSHPQQQYRSSSTPAPTSTTSSASSSSSKKISSASNNATTATTLNSNLSNSQIPSSLNTTIGMTSRQSPPQQLPGRQQSAPPPSSSVNTVSANARPVRLVTGTGTIREAPGAPYGRGPGLVVGGGGGVLSGTGGGGSGVAGGGGTTSSAASRRKPVRPNVETSSTTTPRNQASEPPPPH